SARRSGFLMLRRRRRCSRRVSASSDSAPTCDEVYARNHVHLSAVKYCPKSRLGLSRPSMSRFALLALLREQREPSTPVATAPAARRRDVFCGHEVERTALMQIGVTRVDFIRQAGRNGLCDTACVMSYMDSGADGFRFNGVRPVSAGNLSMPERRGAFMGKFAKLAMVAATPAMVATSAVALERTQAGDLTCDISGGIGLIFGSQRTLNCTFMPSTPGPVEYYTGTLTKLGVDVGVTAGGVMIWLVFAPTSRPAGGGGGGCGGRPPPAPRGGGRRGQRARRRIQPDRRTATGVAARPDRLERRRRRCRH